MWRSRSLLPLTAAALLAFAHPDAARADQGTGDHEIGAFYTSFAANIGGLPELGARYRSGHFEVNAMALDNQFGLELGYTYRFNPDSWLVPRVIFGVAYAFGGLAFAPGVDFSFPIIPVGSGKAIGLNLDAYLYTKLGAPTWTTPVIPLSIAYFF